jgi:hypothetical protein
VHERGFGRARTAGNWGRTAEHPFGTTKACRGATHFLTRTLKRVAQAPAPPVPAAPASECTTPTKISRGGVASQKASLRGGIVSHKAAPLRMA